MGASSSFGHEWNFKPGRLQDLCKGGNVGKNYPRRSASVCYWQLNQAFFPGFPGNQRKLIFLKIELWQNILELWKNFLELWRKFLNFLENSLQKRDFWEVLINFFPKIRVK